MVGLLCISFINSYNTKDFIKTKGTITNHIVEENFDYYNISYKIGQKRML